MQSTLASVLVAKICEYELDHEQIKYLSANSNVIRHCQFQNFCFRDRNPRDWGADLHSGYINPLSIVIKILLQNEVKYNNKNIDLMYVHSLTLSWSRNVFHIHKIVFLKQAIEIIRGCKGLNLVRDHWLLMINAKKFARPNKFMNNS